MRKLFRFQKRLTDLTFKRLLTISTKFLILFSAIFIICVILIGTSYLASSHVDPESDSQSILSSRQAWHVSPVGIAIDSQENLYLGVEGNIMVYNKEGNFKHSYRIATPGTYTFTVDNEDNIVAALSRTQRVLVYNQDGTLINEIDDTGKEQYYSMYDNRKTVHTHTRGNYQLSNFLGYTKVTHTIDQETDVIYRIPFSMYIVKLAIPIGWFSMMIVIGHFAAKIASQFTDYD